VIPDRWAIQGRHEWAVQLFQDCRSTIFANFFGQGLGIVVAEAKDVSGNANSTGVSTPDVYSSSAPASFSPKRTERKVANLNELSLELFFFRLHLFSSLGGPLWQLSYNRPKLNGITPRIWLVPTAREIESYTKAVNTSASRRDVPTPPTQQMKRLVALLALQPLQSLLWSCCCCYNDGLSLTTVSSINPSFSSWRDTLWNPQTFFRLTTFSIKIPMRWWTKKSTPRNQVGSSTVAPGGAPAASSPSPYCLAPLYGSQVGKIWP